jgi:hypothetical protein
MGMYTDVEPSILLDARNFNVTTIVRFSTGPLYAILYPPPPEIAGAVVSLLSNLTANATATLQRAILGQGTGNGTLLGQILFNASSSSNSSSNATAAALQLLLSAFNATRELEYILQGQTTLRPVSQAFSVWVSTAHQSSASVLATMTIPIDARTRYLFGDALGTGRRRMLLQQTVDSAQYNQYVRSNSVIRPTLQAYWLDSSTNKWVPVPGQTVDASDRSITLSVTRGMLPLSASSSSSVTVAAFAVSQPPPRAQSSVTAQQLFSLLFPPVSASPSSNVQKATTAATLHSTTTAPMAETTPPPPPPATTMDAGVVAGIVIACIGVTAGLATLLYFKLRPTKAKKQESAGIKAEGDKKPIMEPAEEEKKTLRSMFQVAGSSVSKFSKRQQQQPGGALYMDP